MAMGKNQKAVAEKIEKEKFYNPVEALTLLKEVSFTKFDESVELHVRLGVDPKQAEQQVRGSVNLPFGTGKSVRVAVFATGDQAKEAQEAGAEAVGGQDLVDKVESGWLEFDAAVATPDLMKIVSRLGKMLGPRGLMPNPKVGTVTMDVGRCVSDLKKGKVEYRTDKFGIIHVPLGKVSFDVRKLLENYVTVMEEILRAKPAAAKGRYLKSVSLSTTMGPGLKVDSARIKEWLEDGA